MTGKRSLENRMKSCSYRIDDRSCIEVVSDLEGFVRLRENWNDLSERGISNIPWLCHDWFSLWLRHFLGRSRLFILVVRESDRVIGIFPLLVGRASFKGIPGIRKIGLIGNVHSPVRSFLLGTLNEGERRLAVRKVIRFLQKVWRNWDVLEMQRILEENCSLEEIQRSFEEAGFEHRAYFCDANWFEDGIECSFSEYFARLSKNHRKDIGRCRRNLEKLGDLNTKIIVDDQKVEDWLGLYDTIRTRSWKAPEKDKEFIREFARLCAEQGWMRLGFLFLGNIPIAGEKWIVRDGKGWSVDAVYDKEYAKYSPGKVLSFETTQYVIDQDGVSEIDYMTGDEPYKRQWVSRRRERKGIDIYNRTLRGRFLAFLMKRMLPTIEKYPVLALSKEKASSYFRRRG